MTTDVGRVILFAIYFGFVILFANFVEWIVLGV